MDKRDRLIQTRPYQHTLNKRDRSIQIALTRLGYGQVLY